MPIVDEIRKVKIINSTQTIPHNAEIIHTEAVEDGEELNVWYRLGGTV